jgi:hypothetical protein
MSGLNQRFTKPPFLNRNREFESHRLRPENDLSEFIDPKEHLKDYKIIDYLKVIPGEEK